jgi:hypothetical protein
MSVLELNPPRLRPKAEAATPRLIVEGNKPVKTVRSNTTDPIALRASPPKMGTIVVRFVILLFVAVVLLALAWSR